MDAETSEPTTSKDGQTDEDGVDAVRALAEVYAQIEHVEEHTDDEVSADLETAKTAICRAHGTLFDVEVDRAYRELSDADEADE
jgi:hypothetical protein